MEYASGGNLHSYIVDKSMERGGRGIGEKESKWIFQQVELSTKRHRCMQADVAFQKALTIFVGFCHV